MSVLQSTPQEDSLTHTDESRKLIRERVFPPAELEKILLQIHEARATGVLMLDMNQGGLCSIRFREEHKIDEGGSNVTATNSPDALAHSAFLSRSRA